MLGLFLVPLVAGAGDAITLSAVRHAQHELSSPSVTFHPAVSGSLTASLACGGRSFRVSEAISPGRDVTIDLTGLPRGTFRCTGKLDLSVSDGTQGSMPLAVEVTVHPPLKVTVAKADLDLDARRMTVHADRPIRRVAVRVFGERGVEIGSGEAPAGGESADLEWSQTDGEALKLVVTAWDEHELPGGVELSPWSYAIPHEDVVFETGKHAILPGEVHKLEHAWTDVASVLERYGPVVEVNLFVAGYTDTVGDPASNEVLSWNRARAIAGWFKARGFKGQIWYQGFGETVLAVPTPDETDTLENRRALYLLAAEKPGITTDFPRISWKRL